MYVYCCFFISIRHLPGKGMEETNGYCEFECCARTESITDRKGML